MKRFFPQPHTFVDRNGKCVCDRSEINVASSRRAGAVPAAPRCRWPASATSSCAHRHRHMLRRIAGMTNSQECWLSSSNRRIDNLEFDVCLMFEIETVFICCVKEQHSRTPILARFCEPRNAETRCPAQIDRASRFRTPGHEKRTPILVRFSLVLFEAKRYKTRMKGNDYDLPAATPHGQLEVLETRKRSMTNCPIHKVASPSA